MENTENISKTDKYVTLSTLKTYDEKLKDWTKTKYNIPVFETWQDYEDNKNKLSEGTKFIVIDDDSFPTSENKGK